LAFAEANQSSETQTVAFVLSVGTGKGEESNPIETNQGWKWLLKMANVATDVKHTTRFMKVMAKEFGFTYTRWQAPLDVPIQLDTSNVSAIKEATMSVTKWMCKDDKVAKASKQLISLYKKRQARRSFPKLTRTNASAASNDINQTSK
jgi:hypothetical protein